MPPFEDSAPAELFLAKRTKNSHDNDRRFATAAEAIRYTVEDYAHVTSFLLALGFRFGDERFNSVEIQRNVQIGGYPLRKSASD